MEPIRSNYKHTEPLEEKRPPIMQPSLHDFDEAHLDSHHDTTGKAKALVDKAAPHTPLKEIGHLFNTATTGRVLIPIGVSLNIVFPHGKGLGLAGLAAGHGKSYGQLYLASLISNSGRAIAKAFNSELQD